MVIFHSCVSLPEGNIPPKSRFQIVPMDRTSRITMSSDPVFFLVFPAHVFSMEIMDGFRKSLLPFGYD